jgi:uncharacterized OsmC-like protein
MQYFAASLAGCQNEQAQVVAEELSLNITTIDIDLEIGLDLASFMGMADHSNGSYKKVRMTAVVHGDLSEAQVQELGNKVYSRSPILALLQSFGCDINSSLSL